MCNPNVNRNDIVVLVGVYWSDDFELNTSVKTNRASVWLKTLKFLSETYLFNDIKNTYPISMGLKSISHNLIESLYVKELSEIPSGIDNVFLCMQHKKHVWVHFEIIAALGNQPE